MQVAHIFKDTEFSTVQKGLHDAGLKDASTRFVRGPEVFKYDAERQCGVPFGLNDVPHCVGGQPFVTLCTARNR